MELISMTTEPSAAASMTPPGPRMTSSTSGESLTMVMVTSLLRATSAGESATLAPISPSSSALLRVLLYTVKGKPALRMLEAWAFPMIPRPTNPTRSCFAIDSSLYGPVTGFRGRSPCLCGPRPPVPRIPGPRPLISLCRRIHCAPRDSREGFGPRAGCGTC